LANCVKNIGTKNYRNLVFGFQVTVENVGDAFLGHSVRCPDVKHISCVTRACCI